jgi:hypothetical protein
MKRIRVNSSCVSSIGYARQTQVLEVEFVNGGLYRYFEVEPEIYEQFLHAESHGTYFNEEIKGAYRYAIIREPRP